MCTVGRRFVRAKAWPRGWVNRADMRIPVIVGTERSENLRHRKGKGSFPMQIREGLVDPKRAPSWSVFAKGKPVNIPVLMKYAW